MTNVLSRVKNATKMAALKYAMAGGSVKDKMRFALSSGGRIMVNPSIAYYAGLTPGWAEWNLIAGILEGLNSHPVVNACNRLSTDPIGQVEFFIESKNVQGKWVRDEKVKANYLITKPAPKMTMNSLVKMRITDLNCSGNFVDQKLTGFDGKLNQINPLRILGIKPVTDMHGRLGHYEFYDITNQYTTFDPDEVIHGQYYNPYDANWGIGRLEVLARTIDTDNEAIDWNKANLKNRGVMDGIFLADEAEEDDRTAMQSAIETEFLNNSDRTRSPILLTGPSLKYQQLSSSMLDADWTNGRKRNREDIAGLFSVPLPLLGVSEGTTFNNFSEAKKFLWQFNLIPAIEHILDIYNAQLANDYADSVRIAYTLEYVDVLQEDQLKKAQVESEKAKAAVIYMKAGIPFEEINSVLELGFDAEKVKAQLLKSAPQFSNT